MYFELNVCFNNMCNFSLLEIEKACSEDLVSCFKPDLKSLIVVCIPHLSDQAEAIADVLVNELD